MRYCNHTLRHELKYYINYHEYNNLKSRLKWVLSADINSVADEGYHIRSLYFDDIYNSALYEKNFGVFRRKKYRIRIYNKDDRVIKLERKNKFGQYISKDSASLSKDDYYRIMDDETDFLLQTESPLKKDFYYEHKTNLLRPKVIVDYEREAYILDSGNVRITFDKILSLGLNSFDIFDKNLVTLSAIPESMLILEIKYDDFLPGFVRNLVQISMHNQSAISKYVICRLILNDYTKKG